jgi:hypothetical protein
LANLLSDLQITITQSCQDESARLQRHLDIPEQDYRGDENEVRGDENEQSGHHGEHIRLRTTGKSATVMPAEGGHVTAFCLLRSDGF